MTSEAPSAYTHVFSIGVSYDAKIGPDGSTVVTTRGSKVVLWDVAAEQIRASAALPHPSEADFSPGGDRIAAMTTSGACATFAAPTLEPLFRVHGRGFGEGPGPVFGPDGDHYVQASWNGDLAVRRADDGEIVLRERDRQRMITGLVCSSDRMLFAFGGTRDDEAFVSVRRWPFDQNEAVELIRFRNGYPSISALALDGHRHLAIRETEKLSVLDLDTASYIATRRARISGNQESLAWSPQGELAATDKSADDIRQVLGLNASLDTAWSLDVPYASSVHYSPSGELLAIGSWESGCVMRRTPGA